MGYNNQSTVYGNQGVGTAFIRVDGNGGTMKDLTVTGYGDAGYAENEIYCCKLDISGGSKTMMYWIDYQPDFYGWYSDDGGEDYNDEELAPGEGLWLNSPNPDCKVVSSGQVNEEATTVTLVYGNQLCPNPAPTTLKMGQCWVTGYGDEGYAENEIYCCKLDISGGSKTMMYWIEYEPDYYGWYSDDGGEDYNNETILPGESIWLNSPVNGYQLHWPSAFNPDSNTEERAKE